MSEMWQTELLLCPACASDNLKGEIPNIKCNNCGQLLHFDKNHILRTDVPQSTGVEFHEVMERGTTLRELQNRPLHLANWETSYYKKAIAGFLSGLIKNDWVALDVGCGDGRFTDFLIELGANKIVASDCNLHSLESLAKHATEKNYRDKLLIIQSDAQQLPVRKSSIDLGLSIGVLYYLNERFEEGLSSVVSLIKEGGYFLASEPDLEGCSLKALVFEGIDDFVLTIKDKIFTETVNGLPFKFRTFDRDEIKTIYNKFGLNILGYHGLSIFPSLLVIGKARGMFDENGIKSKEQDLRSSFDFYDNAASVFKHIIWFCRKRQQKRERLMLSNDIINLRPLERKDLETKVNWLNDPDVNKYLHYDIPLSLARTEKWFERVISDESRLDLIIETLEAKPIGIIGLLRIDNKNSNAFVYITIGEKDYWRKGIGQSAVKLLLDYAFRDLGLLRLHTWTETDNKPMQRVFESVGFKREGLLRKHIYNRTSRKYADLIYYGILNSEYCHKANLE